MNKIILTLISNADVKVKNEFINQQKVNPIIIQTSISIDWNKIINGIVLESNYFKMIRCLIEIEIEKNIIDRRLLYPTIEIKEVIFHKISKEEGPIINWDNEVLPISKIDRIIDYKLK